MHLVIVESPAKAKTIKRFLGKEYIVEASMGHVRDLPTSILGVDTDSFEPTYEIPKEKQTVTKKLREALKEAKDLWIATDEDREGEAIGWHLTQILKVKDLDSVNRIVFHEITEEAIQEAVAHPRKINMRLVDAQQARRVLDRLVGYTLSPFLWKKVYRGLSAGRVQSVAVRIIVDRERQIQAFQAQEYWTIGADLETPKGEAFTALLQKRDGQKFIPESKEQSEDVLADLQGASYAVDHLEEKEVKRNPPAPFTTSTLQQEASRKLGFSVKQTMVVAQQLYEGVSLGSGEGSTGLITYMRTDSVHLSEKALSDARVTIEQRYGREYVLAEARKYQTKSKGAQEAHEAIRPTETSRSPESLADVLDHQQLKLYTLIWNRTMATQMPSAEFRRVGADIRAEGPASIAKPSGGGRGSYMFRATGQTVIFDGYLRVYREDRDEVQLSKGESAEEGDDEKLLPQLTVGESLMLDKLVPEQHFTKPPPRYTEASLVKKLEEEGIGRPSTYAPTISTIQQRGYIMKDGKQLKPNDVAFTVTDLLAEHFHDIVDLQFTAQMEQSLDDIAEGKTDSPTFLRGFYDPFASLVKTKSQEIKKEDVLKERILGVDPQTNLPVVVRTGRFGPYVQLGQFDNQEKAEKGPRGAVLREKRKIKKPALKTASVPKHLTTETVTFEQALSLLSFPRMLGVENGESVFAHLGRYGPYVQCGKTTCALPKDVDPMSVTLVQALAFIVDRKAQKEKAAEALRELGKDPASGGDIKVKVGRFGPYVTDGKTNASLGKKFDPERITPAEAADLLAKKRAAPAGKWKGRWAKKGS